LEILKIEAQTDHPDVFFKDADDCYMLLPASNTETIDTELDHIIEIALIIARVNHR